ncbi:unnamed protein product [Periconia digitata]|uniref:Uncharacterized protein n=1 Tax=Periconia digitata TaxID=1303443 RepID=A0A9W4U5I8_9PLEO|nr:unnamed protein product [Periconia digitata]
MIRLTKGTHACGIHAPASPIVRTPSIPLLEELLDTLILRSNNLGPPFAPGDELNLEWQRLLSKAIFKSIFI